MFMPGETSRNSAMYAVSAIAPIPAITRGPNRGYSRPRVWEPTPTPIASTNVVVPDPIGDWCSTSCRKIGVR